MVGRLRYGWGASPLHTYVALTVGLFAVVGPLSAQETGAVRGSVVADGTGAALSSVDVFVPAAGRRALTDRSGRFVLVGLRPGSWELVAERVGYGTGRQSVTVTPGGTADVTFRLADRALSIPEVVVTASREAQNLSEVAASVGVIGSAALRDVHPAHPSEIMGQVPGVWVNVTGGEGHMTAIRQPLSTSPVYLYLEDGVPTRSTGFFNHNALYEVNVPQADRIEVMKGPASALYGSDAIGGVINVGTRAPSQDTEAELSLEGGAYGYKRLLASLSGTPAGNGLRADFNATRTDGWREGTQYDRYSGTLRWDRRAGEGSFLKTVLTYSSIDQNTAGSSAVSRSDFESDPTVNYTPISYRDVQAFRASAAYERQAATWKLSLTPYARYNSMDILPNWSLTYDPSIYRTENSSVGILAKVDRPMLGQKGRVIAGVDVDYSPGSYREHSITPAKDGKVFTSYADGATLYDYDVTFHQVSPYVHAEVTPTDGIHLSGGLRFDVLGYDYQTHLAPLQTGSHRRPGDGTPGFAALSPKVGITFQATDGMNLFASFRRGFRAPSEGQLFRQGSATNTVDLEPVKANSLEAGLRGHVGSRVSYDVALYRMSKLDDVLDYRHDDGHTESVNAGETLHRGVEVGVGLGLAPGVEVDVSYSVAKHTYQDWRLDDGTNYSGKEMEFAPHQIGNVRLELSPTWLGGAHATLEWVRVGPYWMDAANENEYEGHDLLNARVTYSVTERLDLFARLDNLGDTRYAERASYNAFRGQELAPGMPRTLYAGVRIR